MESTAKRRKLDHGAKSFSRDELINFESQDAARVSTASTFILQTDELLRESRIDYDKTFKGIDTLLHKLKTIVESIEPHAPLPISEATTKLEKARNVKIPYPHPRPEKDAPYKLSFEKPAQCNVVGSYVSRTMVKSQSQYGIDMVVQMPSSMFKDKDIYNMRYFYRRAYYIAYIATQIQTELKDSMDAAFEYLNDNLLLPVLVMRSKATPDASVNKTFVRVVPCAPDDLFPLKKLTSNFSCNKTAEADIPKKGAASTPFYNSTLKAESSFITYLRLLAKAQKDCASFQDACLLGRIWLRQRGFGGCMASGGFGHFEWALMTALLLKTGGRHGKPALSTSLSGQELFKAVIQFLSTTDFNKKPMILGSSDLDLASIKDQGPVMHDAARELNILYKMTPWSAGLLKHHATSAADLLADEATDSFESIFIVKADAPLQIFDAQFEINTLQASKLPQSLDSRGRAMDSSAEAHRVLSRGYGDRAHLVHVQQTKLTSWSLASSSAEPSDTISVGVIFDPAHMSRQMEYGPSAEEQKEAARFRQFWGEKAELRRFKDGSILECVEWKGKVAPDLCQEIATYVLGRHLGLSKDGLVPSGSNLFSIIEYSHLDKSAFDAARSAFQTLERNIRDLEDLPLQIRNLSLISPEARYASIVPPHVGFHTGFVTPLEVNIYFESSSKWPENLTAIQEAKIEFLLDIDRRLTAAHENINTYLGRENRGLGTENLAYLDIIYDSGASFRLRVHADLEETILDRQVKNKTLDAYIRDEAAETLARFHWLYTTLPLHTQTIATFCTRLPALSPTIRLLKHWFNCHKLSSHVSEELIELFALYSFLQPYPWKMPTSASTGFLRSLHFLSRWDWRIVPLIVDTAETLTAEDRYNMRHSLDALRQRDPNMSRTTLFVATSHAPSGLAYTRHSPSKLVASRMTRLAKAAYKLVRPASSHLDASKLFQPSLRDYDVCIHLSPKVINSVLRAAGSTAADGLNGTVRASSRSQFKNLNGSAAAAASTPLPLRVHPVDVLIAELERVFEDSLLFFRGDLALSTGLRGRHGANVGYTIGAIWVPKLATRSKFRVGLPYNFVSANKLGDDDDIENEEDMVQVNKKAVLLEIARIGGDLIRKIEMDEDE